MTLWLAADDIMTQCNVSVTVFLSILEGYCDPLGNENIFASIRPMKHNEKSPVILIATRVCIPCVDRVCYMWLDWYGV